MLGFCCCVDVDTVGMGERLALYWKNDFNVSLQSYCVGHIDVLIYDIIAN